MATLHICEPHLVRCLVPNTHKKPGEVGTKGKPVGEAKLAELREELSWRGRQDEEKGWDFCPVSGVC